MRTVRNVHERVIQAPAETAGAQLDLLASPDDPLSPTPVWPPIRFDAPLGVGAKGGHGFVRYAVGAYEPGRSIRFEFTPPWNGFHTLEVEPLTPTSCRVVHTLELRPGLKDRLAWSLAIRPLHDTFIEELLDNLARAATGTAVAHPHRWSRPTRLLRRFLWVRPAATTAPAEAKLAHEAFAAPDFTDAYRIPLAPGMPRDPAAWSSLLPFPVRETAPTELLLGQDASRLDFRASIFVTDQDVTLTTVVKYNNWRGRAYFAVVRHFHPRVTRLMLRRAHRRIAFEAPSAAERAGLSPSTHG